MNIKVILAIVLSTGAIIGGNATTTPTIIDNIDRIEIKELEKLKPIETSKLEPKQIKPPKAVASPPASSSVKAEQVSKFSGKAVTGSKQDWMRQAGIPESDWGCADALVQRESGWRVNAQNPSSSAYGLPQSLPGNKMASAGADWRTNPVTQLKWMDGYTKARYGGWCQADSFQRSNNWY